MHTGHGNCRLLAVAHDGTLAEHDFRLMQSIADVVVTLLHETAAGSRHGFAVETFYRGRGSKAARHFEYYTYKAGAIVAASQPSAASSGADARKLQTEPDPTANLTFNLRLSADEQAARANTAKPYALDAQTKAQALGASTSGTATSRGQIFYEVDDDDVDPDDDLDI